MNFVRCPSSESSVRSSWATLSPLWFSAGLAFLLLALTCLTQERALWLKERAGVPEFPDHLLFQGLDWVRTTALSFGLCLLLAAWIWKPFLKWFGGQHHGPGAVRGAVEVVLFAFFLLAYGLAEILAFQRFPLTPDEFAYLFQAKIIASGHVAVPAHPLQKFFTSAFVAESRGELFSIMPLGWSYFLAPWTWLSIPWMANPFLTAVSGWLLYRLGRELFDARTGLAASLLFLASPYAVYMGGTFFAHPLSLLLVLACTLGLVRTQRGERPRRWFWVCLGLGIAALPIVHHFDLFVLAPLFALLVKPLFGSKSPIRRGILLAAGISLVSFALFTGWHNHRFTGSPLRVPFEIYQGQQNFLGEIPPEGSGTMVGIPSREEFGLRLRRLAGQWIQFNLVMFPLAPLLFFAPLFLRGRNRWDVLLAAAFCCLCAAYLFYRCRGGIQFGPRYYYPAAGFLCLLAARSFCLVADRCRAGFSKKWPAFLFLLSMAYELSVSAGTLRMVRDVTDYAAKIEDVGGWFERRGIQNSIIFLTPSKDDIHTDEVKIYLRVRNEPDFSNTNLTASDLGPENIELMDFYPDRRLFLYEIDMNRLVRGEEMRWSEIRRETYGQEP